MKLIFLYSYPLVGFISVCGFIPQIKALLLAVTSPVNMSLGSWILWAVSSVISFGYGVFILGDLMFCVITGVAIILNAVVIYLIIHRRYVVFGLCRDVFDVIIEYFWRAPYFGICPSKLDKKI